MARVSAEWAERVGLAKTQSMHSLTLTRANNFRAFAHYLLQAYMYVHALFIHNTHGLTHENFCRRW